VIIKKTAIKITFYKYTIKKLVSCTAFRVYVGFDMFA